LIRQLELLLIKPPEWDVGVLLEAQRFLAKDVTLHQVCILIAIHAVKDARRDVEKHGEDVFIEDENAKEEGEKQP